MISAGHPRTYFVPVLPDPHRLRHKKDIDSLFAKGKGVFDPICGVKFRANALPQSRFTVVVGTKISKSAVVRNRIRRRIREMVRLRLSELAPGFDVALLARPEAKTATSPELERHVLSALRKAGLLKRV